MGHQAKDTPGALEAAIAEGDEFPLVPLDPEPEPEPDPKPAPEPDPDPDPEPAPEPDPDPDPPPPDPKPDPDETGEYTQEEFDALPEDEREAIQKRWDDHEAATSFDEDATKANLTALETKMTQAIADTEAKRVEFETKIKESDKLLTQRTQQIGEAAREHPEVNDKFHFLKDITKQNREDKNRQAAGFKPKIYFHPSNTPKDKGETPAQYDTRLKEGNRQANVANNQNMLETQDMITDLIAPIMPEIERMRAQAGHQKNMYAWGETTLALMEEMKIPDSPEAGKMFADIAKDLGNDLMGQGTSLSPDSRANILRTKILLAQSGYKPAGKVHQFNGKAPPGKLRGRKPPRRPPNTIAGRGTGSPSKKGTALKPGPVVGKAKITPEFLTAGGQVPGEDD